MRNAELNDMSYVTRSPISLDFLVAEVASPECGGTCLFLGTVRNGPGEQGVTAIEYSAYEEMVEAEFIRLLTDARARWPDSRIAVRHRLLHDSRRRGEHRDRRGGAASGPGVRGLPLRDRGSEASRTGLEEGAARGRQ